MLIRHEKSWAIGRPTGDQLRHIVERQSGEIAGGDGEQIDISGAGSCRGKGQTFPVWREQRSRLRRRMRYEKPRVTAFALRATARSRRSSLDMAASGGGKGCATYYLDS